MTYMYTMTSLVDLGRFVAGSDRFILFCYRHVRFVLLCCTNHPDIFIFFNMLTKSVDRSSIRQKSIAKTGSSRECRSHFLITLAIYRGFIIWLPTK